MQKFFVLFLCYTFLAVGFSLNAQNSPQLLETPIEQVKIYLKGAEIIRTKTLSLNTGKHQLTFTGLAPKINAKSMQVTATNGVSVLTVTNKLNFLEEGEKSARIELLRDSFDLLNYQIQDLDDERMAYEEEKKVMEQNRKVTTNQVEISAQDITQLADFYRNRFLEINKKLREIARNKHDISQERNRISRQLTELNAGKRPTSQVEVMVNVPNGTSTEIRMRYLVDDAGWSPIYDLVADEIDEPISLKYRALAFNNSGNDWNDVPIILSTADAYKGAAQPILKPWVLDKNAVAANNYQYNQDNLYTDNYVFQGNAQFNVQPQEQVKRYERRQKEYLDKSNSGALSPAQEEKLRDDLDREQQLLLDLEQGRQAVSFQTIEISELSTDFEIEEKHSIPSDSKPYSIDITTHSLKADFKHFTVPKMEKQAFLLAQIIGWENLDLISGPMNVYHGEKYIGLANLNTASVNDTLNLSLGRDNKVAVSRVKLKEQSRKKLFGDNLVSTFSYKITVKNNRAQTVEVELEDQIPITKQKEITIDIEEISKAKLYDATGKLEWNFDLAPGAKKEVIITFSVKHPSNMEVKMKKGRMQVTPRYF